MWIPEEDYSKILKSFPIPCVDLIVVNKSGKLLMLKRKNEPAKGEWWFPGGRVLHGEKRAEAALRKLKDECGLKLIRLNEWKTLEIFLPNKTENYLSHGISTFYIIEVSDSDVRLDAQSLESKWANSEEWQKVISNPFILDLITDIKMIINS